MGGSARLAAMTIETRGATPDRSLRPRESVFVAWAVAAIGCGTTTRLDTASASSTADAESSSPSAAQTSRASDGTVNLNNSMTSETLPGSETAEQSEQLIGSDAADAALASTGIDAATSALTDASASQPESDTHPFCGGTFGEPHLLFQDAGEYHLNSPSITADELSMYYLETPTAEDLDQATTLKRRVVRRARTSLSEPFSEPIVHAEFDDACETTARLDTIQVSRDGLRLYWLCAAVDGPLEGDLRMASRPDQDAPFELSNRSLGHATFQFNVSVDELSLLSFRSTEDLEVVLSRRGSLEEPFSDPVTVVDAAAGLQWPELGPDDATMIGTRPSAAIHRVVVATKNAALGTFDPFTDEGMPATANGPDLGPTLSNDCKRLYFVGFLPYLVRGMYVAER